MAVATILMYHHVSPSFDDAWSVSPAQLRAHLQILKDRGHRVGTLEDVLSGESVVVITFDDAYVNVRDHALPVLAAFEFVATMFVPVNLVGGMNTHDCVFPIGGSRPERIMTWSHLGELQAAGWSIQSHGCSHVPMSHLSLEHIEDEVLRSKRTIEDRIGQAVFAYAYAYGVPPDDGHRRDLENLFESSGYRLALLASGGPTRTPPEELYRVSRMIGADQPIASVLGPQAGVPVEEVPGEVRGPG
jgi:peptidoglycan/xylan/chitin deacetylase (PgdA/CDA1 family)